MILKLCIVKKSNLRVRFFYAEFRIGVKLDKNPVIFFIKQDMLKVAMLRLHAIDIWLNKQHLEHS